jgi:hypothetical protein
MNKALEIALDPKTSYDFTGEIYLKAGADRHKIKTITDKFPELKEIRQHIDAICEVNCFNHGKNGEINHVMSLANLNANHNWSNKSETVNKQSIKIEGLPSEIEKALKDG